MDPAGKLLTLTYSREFDVAEAEQWCYAAGECVSTEPFVPIVLVLVTGITTFAVAAALLHVDRASALLEEERDRTRAERDAFVEFARRVARLDATTPKATIGAAAMASFAGEPPDESIERVKNAYRDTVMAVGHYEEEYDEPLEANVTAELGPEVAVAIADGAAFTPPLKSALVGQAEEARSKREELLRRLDREASDLDAATAKLEGVASAASELEGASAPSRRFDELLDAWESLRDLESRCRGILADRQATLHERSTGVDGSPTIQEYLYQPIDVDYPVLAAGTGVLERVVGTRRDVESAIAGR